jgi:hypothetical protein
LPVEVLKKISICVRCFGRWPGATRSLLLKNLGERECAVPQLWGKLCLITDYFEKFAADVFGSLVFCKYAERRTKKALAVVTSFAKHGHNSSDDAPRFA